MNIITFALLVVGGLNWGLVGLLNIDLVQLLVGGVPGLATIVYVLVGLSALWQIGTYNWSGSERHTSSQHHMNPRHA